MADPGRTYWAALHLLDRQVVDRDGVGTAKVDDLVFAEPDEPGGLPVVTDILCGQAALAARFDRRLGRGLELLRRVLRPEPEPGPARIGYGLVTGVGTHVTLAVTRTELDVSLVDGWLARYVLARVPGSGIPRDGGDR